MGSICIGVKNVNCEYILDMLFQFPEGGFSFPEEFTLTSMTYPKCNGCVKNACTALAQSLSFFYFSCTNSNGSNVLYRNLTYQKFDFLMSK